MKKIIIFISLWGAALVALIASPANALSVRPLRYAITVDPGKNQLVAITVSNDEKSAREIFLFVIGVEQDERGRPIFKTGIDDAEQWVAPEIKSIFLAPGARQIVAFNVKVPAGAFPGEHTIGLVARAGSLGAPGALAAQLVVPVSLQVAGLAREALELSFWRARRSATMFSPRRQFEGQVFNNGTVAVPLQGSVTIRDRQGNKISEQTIPLGNKLLPQAFRTFFVTVTADAGIFLPRIYRADLRLTYGITKRTLVASEPIFYLPPVFLFSLAVALVLVLWRRFRKKTKSV